MAQTTAGARVAAAAHYGITPAALAAHRAAGRKRCRRCREWKVPADFNRDASRPDGRAWVCRSCRKTKVKKDRKGRPSIFKGRSHTVAAKAKMSASRLGKPGPGKGQSRPPEVRKKISDAGRALNRSGPACAAYIDGRNAHRRGDRESAEYKRWRRDVYTRDGFACQVCGDNRGGNLNAHHIYPFAKYPAMRLVLDNGITLCEPCHEARHYKPASVRNLVRRRGLIRVLKVRSRR